MYLDPQFYFDYFTGLLHRRPEIRGGCRHHPDVRAAPGRALCPDPVRLREARDHHAAGLPDARPRRAHLVTGAHARPARRTRYRDVYVAVAARFPEASLPDMWPSSQFVL
jgi:hypothetical protein